MTKNWTAVSIENFMISQLALSLTIQVFLFVYSNYIKRYYKIFTQKRCFFELLLTKHANNVLLICILYVPIMFLLIM
jgi:hypothetical protein